MTEQLESMPDSEIYAQEISPEMLSNAGEVLSRSTLFALRRNYLDAPVVENKIFSEYEVISTEIQSLEEVLREKGLLPLINLKKQEL